MTKTLVRSVTINAPVDAVFAFVSDPSKWMHAYAGEVEATHVDIKPGGVGTSARMSAKMFGVHMGVTHEYTEVVPNQRIVSTVSAGPVITFSFEPVEGGTALTIEARLALETPLVRVPLQTLWVMWVDDDIDALLANIKSLVETGQKAVTGADMTPAGVHPLVWSGSVSIAAPVERVFTMLKDPHVWIGEGADVSNIKETPEGVGTTFDVAWRVLGIPLKTTHEYTEYVPNEHLTSKAALGPVFTLRVEPEGEGTKLTYRCDVVPSNWADAAVDALVMKMSERGQAELLQRIKEAAEAQVPQA